MSLYIEIMCTQFPLTYFEQLETPFYYYDTQLLLSTIRRIKDSLLDNYYVHYAIKANNNKHILQLIAKLGIGADCVSGGEIMAAIEAGFEPSQIVYSGVGKSDKEIILALEKGIYCFNVESIEELDIINLLAGERNIIAPIALRINPHIDAHTHHYITTGLSENKFGIDITLLKSVIIHLQSLSNIHLRGLHFHIGSQILTLEPYRLLCHTIRELKEQLYKMGINIDYINVGGGLGVDYERPDEQSIPDFRAFFDVFKENLSLNDKEKMHFELGRSIVCQCGSLITRVLYVKQGLDKQFVIVDGGMTELIRPALYQAEHKIENISSRGPLTKYDIVGPICETSDTFSTDIYLPQTHRGDFIAIRSAGAYGESMASQYNCRALPHSVFR